MCLSVESELVKGFPDVVKTRGVILHKKNEFHVTLLSIRALCDVARIAEEEVVSLFDDFAKKHRIAVAGFLDDFRFAEDDQHKTIIVRCIVSNLDALFAELNRTFHVALPVQPAHVTLYTLQNIGIHIPSEKIMESLPRIDIPELETALKTIKHT